MTPRKIMTSVGYAFRANDAANLSGSTNVFPADGNVGVGTKDPSRKLSVVSTEQTRIHIKGDAGAGGTVGYDIDSGSRRWQFGSKGSNEQGAFMLYDGTAGQRRVTIDSSGNTGIGLKNPTEKLQVAGMIHSKKGGFKFPDGTVQTTACDSSGGGGNGGAGNTLDKAYDQGGKGAGRTINADAGAVNITGANGLTVSGNIGIGTTHPIRKFQVESAWDSSSFVVTGGGSVGIGTAYPIRKFHIANTVDSSSFVVTGGGLVGVGTTHPIRKFQVENIGDFTDFVVTGGGNVGIGTTDPIRKFQIENEGDDTDFVVNWSGDVGIGTKTPQAKLNVQNGSIQVGDKAGLYSHLAPVELAFHRDNGPAYICNAGAGSIAFTTNGGADSTRMVIGTNGNVGIGIGNKLPSRTLEVKGNILLLSKTTNESVLELGEGLDYAEGFNVTKSNEISSGCVLIINPDDPGKLTLSNQPYDNKVAGIVAGANNLGSGVRLGAGQFDYDVALAGRVYCNVDASDTGIEPGDLLTTSSIPGYAMKAAEYKKAQGAILGKAMQKLEKGKKGQILVLVTLQ